MSSVAVPAPEPEAQQHNIARLQLNHPKNYLGVPVAVKASGDTAAMVMGSLTKMAGAAKMGARAFGLLTESGDVTQFAHQLIEDVVDEEYSAYLASLEELKRSRERFVSERPEWAPYGHRIAYEHPATAPVVSELESAGEITLPELVLRLKKESPQLVSELFIARDVDDIGRLSFDDLSHPEPYRGTGVCQFKTVLYHLGVLSSPGTSTDYLNPTQETWVLDTVEGGDV